MAMKIDPDMCTACGDCKPVCPTKSISSGKIFYKIDAATCTECSGKYKDKPYVGIVTLWNLSPTSNGNWGNGNGYKPSEDRHFKVKSVELIDSGERVRVTGCVLFICKKAEWVRVH